MKKVFIPLTILLVFLNCFLIFALFQNREDGLEQDAQVGAYEWVFPVEEANDWQKAYHDKLCAIRKANEQIHTQEQQNQIAESYFLYDIDYNGVPELYVRCGTCQVAYHVIVYLYDQAEVKILGDLDACHIGFHSTPKKRLMSYYGHTGRASADLVTLQDGKFTYTNISEQGVIEQDPEEDDVLVPGAKYLVEHNIGLDLPIMLYGKTCNNTAGTLSNKKDRQALKAVYTGNGKVYGASGDGYGKATGVVSFDTYCKPGYITDHIIKPVKIGEQMWLDLNQDGQDECVLKMTILEEPIYVMLSLQEDRVYAYSLFYWGGDTVFYEDGTFNNEDYSGNRVVFDKDQCYTVDE